MKHAPDADWRAGCNAGDAMPQSSSADAPSLALGPSSEQEPRKEVSGNGAPATVRHASIALFLVIALNAIGGGLYGLGGAKGVPVEWLAGSPFKDYALPSAFLLFAVGGSASLAALAIFASWNHARALALFAALLLVAWITVETAIIGYVSWLQPATALAAAMAMLLSFFLPAGSRAP